MARLCLEAGSIPVPRHLREMDGKLFGASRSVRGELVFNTAMSGYVETLTDPSYAGQILVLTYPLQGNYGVPSRDTWESNRIQVQGLIVNQLAEYGSHWNSEQSLDAWAKQFNVPILTHIDTRTLTRFLREHGTVSATIEATAGAVGESASGSLLKSVVSDTEEIWETPDARVELLVVDTGVKENILRSLQRRGARLHRVPWHLRWEDKLSQVDGVLLANGPGDPAHAQDLIARVRGLFNLDLPVFGVCLGHQLLSLAAGAVTSKMKYGHRAINQSVRDLRTGQCYLTSQNHGYQVEAATLPAEFVPWFENLHDHTNEGMRHVSGRISSVQFHPEASPGPHDTSYLFDQFVEQAFTYKKQRAQGATRRA